MTEFTFDYDLFSDLYKDVNGFRPRGHRFYMDSTTDEERQEIWNATIEELDVVMNREREWKKEAIAKFETRIDQLIKIGAKTRETAIRWIREAQDEIDQMYGDEYLEYSFGLPYGYIKNPEVRF